MPECIHGLDVPLCDLCYPKTPPAKPAASRPSTPRTPRAGAVTTTRKSIDPAQQRAYHVTHVRNLEAILAAEGLQAGAAPVVDLSTELTRELRRTAEVAPGTAVSDLVPFYLAPSATRWEELRTGAQDETRWSPAARAAASSDFVVLVATVGALGQDAVIADGDAAATFTRFATGDELGRALTRLHDSEALDEAEVLAAGPVPLTAVQLIGVANDRVRDAVRALTSTKIAVYPPWFQAAED